MKFRLSKRMKLLMLGTVVLCLAVVGVVNFTTACRLEQVKVNGTPLEQWHDDWPLVSDAPITHQPLDSLASLLLAGENTYRVDLNWAGLRTLDINTNRFEPVALAVNPGDGALRAFDRFARWLPLDNTGHAFDCPVLTGLPGDTLLALCSRAEVSSVVAQLPQLKRRHRDLYPLIEGIHFTDDGCLDISLAGLNYRLKAEPAGLTEAVDRYVKFVSGYGPDLAECEYLDLRFEGMIVVGGEG